MRTKTTKRNGTSRIHNVDPEIQGYFLEQYGKHKICVAPGHWPRMITEKDVDEWISRLDIFASYFDDWDNIYPEYNKEDI